MKKLISALLMIVMLFTMVSYAGAYSDNSKLICANVKQISENSILLERIDERGEIDVKINENTLYMDSKNAIKGNIKDIKPNDTVYVFYNEDKANAIVYNIPQDTGCAMLHTIEKLEFYDGGQTKILTDNGGMYIGIDKDAKITNYSDGKQIKDTDLFVGQKIFAWYNGVEESYPAQTSTYRLVLVDEGQTADILLNGKAIATKAVLKNGVWTVPMRETAETLGLEVSWNADERIATMKNSARIMDIKIGEDLYSSYASEQSGMIGMTAPIKLGCKAYISEDITWIPAKVFEIFVGFDVTQNNNTIEIKKAS